MHVVAKIIFIACDVHVMCSRQVAQSCLIRHQINSFAILLPVGWFGEINLFKLQRIFGLKINL